MRFMSVIGIIITPTELPRPRWLARCWGSVLRVSIPPFSEPSVCSGDLLLLVAIQEWRSKGIFKGTFQDISIVVMGPRYSDVGRGLTVWLRLTKCVPLYLFRRWRVSIASTQFKWWSFPSLLGWFGCFIVLLLEFICDWGEYLVQWIVLWGRDKL